MTKKLLYTFIVLSLFAGLVQAQQDIDVKGNGVSIADGDTTPDLADHTDFGNVTVGSSVTRTFTIENIGTADLNLNAIGTTLGTSGQFSVSTGSITTPVTVGNTTTFTVTLTPNVAGPYSGGIIITSDAPSPKNQYTFSIQGTGVAPSIPDINIQGNGLDIVNGDTTPDTADNTDFGQVAVGSSLTKTFTIQNTGGANLNIASVGTGLGSSSQFAVNSSSTTTPLGGGNSTQFTVTFSPTAAGSASATIVVNSDDPDESPYTFVVSAESIDAQDINVTGNGVDIADGDTTPSSADHTDFGQVTIGNSITRTFFIENTGNLDLNLSSVGLTIDTNAQFSLNDAGTITPVVSGGSTSFTVTFTPTTAGAVTGTVQIVSDDPDSEATYTFAIAAEGLAALQPDINVKGNGVDIADGDTTPDLADHTDFGQVDVGNSLVRTFVIENTGDADLNITSAGLTLGSNGQFTVDQTGITTPVPGGNSTSFTVTFTPTAPGVATGTVIIVNDDPDAESSYTFSITAEGISSDKEIYISGNGQEIVSGDTTPDTADDTDFGQTDVNTGSVTHTFTIKNEGSTDLNLTDPSPYVVISGTNASDFVVATIPTTPIAVSGTTTFSITFNPSAMGVRTATISIANDDTDENPYTFAIQGEGIDAATGSQLLITQYYEGTSSNDRWIEVKNISTTNALPNAYHLALFIDADATIEGGIASNIPNEVVDIPFLAPGEVVLFKRSGAALPASGNMGTPAQTVTTEVCSFTGNDVIVISTSNDANTYNNRTDIIGTVGTGAPVNWGTDKSYIKGCGTTETPSLTYTGDYIELELDDVNNANPNTNIALGTQTIGPTIWSGGSWSNGIPGPAKAAVINGSYTAANGSFDACNLIINGSGSINLDGGTTNYVYIEHDLTINGSFVIGNTEALVMGDPNANISGQITKKETTTALNNYMDFTYWSSPVQGANLGTVFAGVERIFQWVKPATGNSTTTEDDVWEPASGTMVTAKGYIAEANPSTPDGGTYTVSFTGKPHNGLTSINLGFNNDGDNQTDYNLIGNPYPSAIDIDEFIKLPTNTEINGGTMSGSIWLWTHRTQISNGTTGHYSADDYATYNLVGGVGSGSGSASGSPAPKYNIGSAQGFFVRALSSGNVNFENFMRLKGENNQFFKPSNNKKAAIREKDRMWLNINSATGGASNQILIGFIEGATDGEDNLYDAYRLSASYLNFYSKIDSLKYAIQAVGEFNTDRKFILGVDTYINEEMEYFISLGDVEGLLQNKDIYLVDNELNVVHDLRMAPYKFSLSGQGEHAERFTLQFTSAVLDVDEFGVNNNFYIVNEDNSLQIKSNNVIERLKVYDLTGRLLMDKEPNDSDFTIPTYNIRKGTVLILNATFTNGAEISKKSIKY
ncbi:MAG: hypothetical protein CSA39_03205 [Flavobacteriales bacterium]|nr:MAG: hypothetical protein CSA39_03205 [Flavobacteriales bacterium]